MKNKELLNKLEMEFNKIKEELNFNSGLEEIDKIFFIKDYIFGIGFVSEKFSRQLCSRITDLYSSWMSYLHGLIMPNPQNILNISEAKLFSQDEKTEINNLMKKAMELSSRHSLIGLEKNKQEESKFIDDAVLFWNDEFSLGLIKIMKKVNNAWRGLK